MDRNSRRTYQSARLENREYWLVPKAEFTDGLPSRERVQPSTLLRYTDPALKNKAEYTYTSLPSDKKRIRLLKLYSGEVSGSHIYCELVEVEYDSQFHIPTYVQPDNTDANKDGSSRDNNKPEETSPADYEESDLETRGKAIKETKAQREERIKRQAVRELEKAVSELKDTKEMRKMKEEGLKADRTSKWKKAKKNEVQYEALSWCWGREAEDYAILIKRGGTTYKKGVRKELALALKYLRRAGRERVLWIDAICIDQANPNERNHQVQMMSRVYTRARKVCIWLGEADADSEIAIKFIKDEMKELKHFDTITTDEQYSRKWQALMSLMQREWFFRRWVVQEIALASAAKVYCGSQSVPWRSFAVAVELFVEVETATHRLSEVMKRDEKFRHVPGWFEYVSELGASLLVQATGRVFRTKRTPMQQDVDTSDEESEEVTKNREAEKYEEQEKRIQETHTIDPLERRSLLSLEYLVSTMFIFQTSEPRDVAYALLAIARDASPFAPAHFGHEDQRLFLVMTLLDRFLAEKPFVVDYTRPYSDVSRDFVEFSIARTHKNDACQALDILCRPWALEPPKKKSARLAKTSGNDGGSKKTLKRGRSAGKWKRCVRHVQRNDGRFENENEKYTYNEGKKGKYRWVPDDRSTTQYWEECEGNEQQWRSSCTNPACTHEDVSKCERPDWSPSPGWEDIKARYFEPSEESDPAEQDISLPSWVARASQAPFMLDHAPGMDMRKTSRANADPLVGSPQDGHRNYNAAGSEQLDLSSLRFRKRPKLGHYSLYVKGFKLDEVARVEDASQLGSIPKSWLELGGWTDLDRDPPDDFWRTIVADRGRDNRNPPYYYARACQESVQKGGHLGGSVNTAALINNEQNSIIAEFCRRVHAVIWNRCLFRTKRGRLGLATNVKAGDKVCILYGCTVPVILERKEKKTATQNNETRSDLDLEDEEDSVEALKTCIRRAIDNRERKVKYRTKKKKYQDENQWIEMMDARQAYLEEHSREKADYETSSQQQRKDAAKRYKWKKHCKERAEEMQEIEQRIGEHDKELVSLREEEKALTDEAKLKETLDEARKKKADLENDSGNASVDQHETENRLQRSEEKQRIDQTIEETQRVLADLETKKENLKERSASLEKTIQEYKEKGDKLKEDLESAALKEFQLKDPAQRSDNGRSTTGTSSASGHEDEAVSTAPSSVEAPQENRNYWYQFKGECYLHGMMDGEAMREKFYKDRQDKVFELR